MTDPPSQVSAESARLIDAVEIGADTFDNLRLHIAALEAVERAARAVTEEVENVLYYPKVTVPSDLLIHLSDTLTALHETPAAPPEK